MALFDTAAPGHLSFLHYVLVFVCEPSNLLNCMAALCYDWIAALYNVQ